MLLYSSPLWMKSISQIKSIEVFLIRGPPRSAQTARLDLKWAKLEIAACLFTSLTYMNLCICIPVSEMER